MMIYMNMYVASIKYMSNLLTFYLVVDWLNPCLYKSAFSFLLQLTTWHRSHLLLSRAHRPCSNRSISPGRRARSSKPAAAACGGRMMGRTDRRTLDSFIGILCEQCQYGTCVKQYIGMMPLGMPIMHRECEMTVTSNVIMTGQLLVHFVPCCTLPDCCKLHIVHTAFVFWTAW